MDSSAIPCRHQATRFNNQKPITSSLIPLLPRTLRFQPLTRVWTDNDFGCSLCFGFGFGGFVSSVSKLPSFVGQCWVGLVLVCKLLVFVFHGGVGFVSCWVNFSNVFEFVVDVIFVGACVFFLFYFFILS